MKTIAKLGLTASLLIAILFSCKRSESRDEESASSNTINDTISSSAAVLKKGETRKFI